ncbi:hypothetical protein [uncultured Oscillibacter sp.]|uniref:hypothetical protein n=1 Tax=uncultured Oscillibacter sp. TaxID=876091 RepID=UPI0025F48336|nr:hypothetical protein [uncultured Oscillibacter sp.]
MASKVINTILNLRDNMSGGLIKAARNTKGVSKEMVSATRSMVAFKNKSVTAIGEVMKKTVKWGAVAAGTVAALAAKTGLSEAMDLEGYRLQLETATKDTQKASEIMKYAIDLANKTPFEGGELVEGAAKFEAMGMAAQKWLPLVGDMAAATNKSFDQATEALIDAQTGELERLKEFGITKAKIVEQGEKMFAGVQIVNNQNQIVNQEKFNEALVGLMQDRFAGGMEKMATTTKGLWSTVTGVTKSALASIAGITTDGSIKSGSALDLLKGKISLLADKLEQWQNDGTIDRISTQFSTGLGKVVDTAGVAFQWIQDHGDGIKRTLVAVASAFAMVKVLKFASDMITAVKVVKGFLSVAGAFLGANPIVLAIGAAIVAGSLLIANWDKVKEWGLSVAASAREVFAEWKQGWEDAKERAGMLWESTKATFGGIRDSIVGAFQSAKEGVSGFFGWLDEKVSGIPVIGSIYKGAKSAGSWISERIGGKATGTSYFSGGLTHVNERGGEIMRLPGGTQIIPHDVSRRMTGGLTITVPVTVQGNVIGNAAYAEQLGNIVAQQLLRALRNT